jgi:hypothetical protein
MIECTAVSIQFHTNHRWIISLGIVYFVFAEVPSSVSNDSNPISLIHSIFFHLKIAVQLAIFSFFGWLFRSANSALQMDTTTALVKLTGEILFFAGFATLIFDLVTLA